MKKKMKFLAFLMAVLAVISMFAVAASAEEAPTADTDSRLFNLGLDYTGTVYSANNPKGDNHRNYASIDIQYRTFELSPQYIYMGVCNNTSGHYITRSVSPSSNNFALDYNISVDEGDPCYLALKTEHRAANCSGKWTS